MSEHQRCRFNIQQVTTMSSLNKTLAHKLLKAKKKNQSGFTLIELIIGVSIVGILTTVGLPELAKSQARARESAAASLLTNAAKECSLDLVVDTPANKVTVFDAKQYLDENESTRIIGDCETDTDLTIEVGEGDDLKTFIADFTGDIPAPVVEEEEEEEEKE